MTISSDNLRMDCLTMTTDRKRMLDVLHRTHFFAAMLYCTLQAVQEAEASGAASMCTIQRLHLSISLNTHTCSLASDALCFSYMHVAPNIPLEHT
jgi:hypothetical protein